MSAITRIFLHLVGLQLALLLSNTAIGQVSIERKIIIEQGQYYYCSVNNETQLASLHYGGIKQKLSQCNNKLIPIGRSIEEPFNPLCFDIQRNELVGINWILNSNNSRYESIKRMQLKNWKSKNTFNTMQMLGYSFEQQTYAPNEPWLKMLADTNVLFDCYFDLIQEHKRLVMAVCNQHKLRISFFANGSWQHKALINFEAQGYFSLVYNGTALGIVDAQGTVYRYDELNNTLHKTTLGNSKHPLLIIDKDHNTLFTVEQEAIDAAQQFSLDALIQQNAQSIHY